MSEDLKKLISNLSNCSDNGKICSENGRRFTIKSEETFTRLRIDPCLIPDQAIKKCDFGFIRHSNEHFLFVELKGSDISTGIDQLISTIEYFNKNFINIPKKNIFCFIVSSKFPKGTEEQKKIQRFARDFGAGRLHIKNNQSVFVI